MLAMSWGGGSFHVDSPHLQEGHDDVGLAIPEAYFLELPVSHLRSIGLVATIIGPPLGCGVLASARLFCWAY